METITVKSFHMVDTISKTNSKAWELMTNILNEKQEDILFDFKDIEIVEPWANETFKKILANDHFHMKVYSADKTVNTINTLCKLGVMTPGRFFNEDVVAPPTLSKEEKKIIQMSKELQKYFIEHNGTAVLEIHRWIDQIGSMDTIPYIERAIMDFSEINGVSNIILDTAAMSIQKNVIELIANVIGRVYSLGINLNIMSTDKDVMNKLGLYQHLATNRNFSVNERYTIATELIPGKMVGMLAKYKKSKAVDEFGRQGEGVCISCRVAKFEGFVKKDGRTCMKFESYNGNTFFTREHWALDNDGEELRELEGDTLEIPLDEIGVFDKFLGKRYHFLTPIQYEEKDNTTMYSLDEDGKLVYSNSTIPMRIKLVMDSWGIDYDEASLIHAITETERILDKGSFKPLETEAS